MRLPIWRGVGEMSNNSKARIVNKNDWLRALLSETTPAELPIIISNDGFYINVHDGIKNGQLKTLVDAIITPGTKKNESVPHEFKIRKDEKSLRRLSLPHPRAQISVCNFYKEHYSLMAYYCQLGKFSIRRPKALSSRYYISGKNDGIFSYRSDDIITGETDTTAKHPASVFSYSGYRRLYKFFSSPTYTSMERKFRFMSSLDISKCFDSIYTHSISWAVKSKSVAKVTKGLKSFGRDFDDLMQSMNYGETNGILIGPEVCRIFAEVILNRIDNDILNGISADFHYGSDYCIFRYVDNFYIFYNKPECYSDILRVIGDKLDYYKLSLNQSKTETKERPFFTNKSMATHEALAIIEEMFDRRGSTKYDGEKRIYLPVNAEKRSASLKKLAPLMRKACHVSGVGYGGIAGFLVAALRRRTQDISTSRIMAQEAFSSGRALNDLQSQGDYNDALIKHHLGTLDFGFHIYTLNPSVTASLDLAAIIVMCANDLKAISTGSFELAREKIQMWISRLISSYEIKEIIENSRVSPVEILNILCALKSFEFDEMYFLEVIQKTSSQSRNTNYFEIVVKLFLLGGHPRCKELRDKVFSDAMHYLKCNADFGRHAESFCLFFDLLSCPHIDKKERRSLYTSVVDQYNNLQQTQWKSCGTVPKLVSVNDRDELIDYCEKNPWFVNWGELNLMRLIERKRLLSGYE